jgi:hypothetical protein
VRRLSPWSCHNQSALSRTYLRPATKMHALRAKSALSPFLRPFRRVDVLWSSWCAHQRTVSCTQTGATHTLPRLVATCGHARRCWCSSRSPLAVRSAGFAGVGWIGFAERLVVSGPTCAFVQVAGATRHTHLPASAPPNRRLVLPFQRNIAPPPHTARFHTSVPLTVCSRGFCS